MMLRFNTTVQSTDVQRYTLTGTAPYIIVGSSLPPGFTARIDNDVLVVEGVGQQPVANLPGFVRIQDSTAPQPNLEIVDLMFTINPINPTQAPAPNNGGVTMTQPQNPQPAQNPQSNGSVRLVDVTSIGEMMTQNTERALAAAGVRNARPGQNGTTVVQSGGGNAGAIAIGVIAVIIALVLGTFGILGFANAGKANTAAESVASSLNTEVEERRAGELADDEEIDDLETLVDEDRRVRETEDDLVRRETAESFAEERDLWQGADARQDQERNRLRALIEEAANRPVHVTVVNRAPEPAPAPTTATEDEFARDIQRATADHYGRVLREGGQQAPPARDVTVRTEPSSEGNNGRRSSSPYARR